MKNILTLAGLIAALVMATAVGSYAQGCPGNCAGGGYGGAPKTEQERLARQAACLEKNGGVCPKGGQMGQFPGGIGQGKGAQNGRRLGPQDGTGAKVGKTAPAQKAPAQSQK